MVELDLTGKFEGILIIKIPTDEIGFGARVKTYVMQGCRYYDSWWWIYRWSQKLENFDIKEWRYIGSLVFWH